MITFINDLLDQVKVRGAYGLYLKSGDRPKLTFKEAPKYREMGDYRPISVEQMNEFLSALPGYHDPLRNSTMWKAHYSNFRVHTHRSISATHIVFIQETADQEPAQPTSPLIIGPFRDEYRFLSNFWPATTPYGGIEYPTAEHAYQAAKFKDADYRRQIANAATPGEAKVLGQTEDYELQDGWFDGLDVMTMSEVVASKFFHNKDLGDQLLATWNAVLVEQNHWHDQRYGNCVCGRPECETPGRNQLGLILMTVRASLKVS